MSEETAPAYISKVRLKGFKSIIDTECTFKPGLNIIIGDNGSGKSNFLDFLEMTYQAYTNPNSLPEKELSWEIDIYVGKNVTTTYQLEKKIDIELLSKNNNSSQYTIVEKFLENGSKYQYEHHPFAIISDLEKVQFGIPDSFIEFSNSVNCTYKKKFIPLKSGKLFIFHSYVNDKNKNPIINDLLNLKTRLYLSSKKLKPQKYSSSLFIKVFKELLLGLNQDLKNFTNISEIRINENFKSSINDTNDEFSISFLQFEFFVNNKWHNWRDLSDGTKRLFYIVSSISLREEGVFLVEEPELGIHPDQLSKLINFLKEQSTTKQIIISTHSPEVLNHLKRDELDRIIICKHEGAVGTKMYHLEEEEKNHLKKYMVKKGFISDYWIYEGFDIEQEVE